MNTPPPDSDAFRRLVEVEAEAARLRSELGVLRADPRGEAEKLSPSYVGDLLATYSRDMLTLHSGDGTYLYVSPSSAALVGWSAEHMVGLNPYEFFHPEDVPRVIEHHTAHSETGADLHVEYRFRDPEGGWRWVETSASALVDGRGVNLILCITRDVQARKEAEEEKARLMTELERRIAEIERLRGLVPICSYCKAVRDDDGFWTRVEDYLKSATGASSTHSICPQCETRLMSDLDDAEAEEDGTPAP